MEPRTPVNQGTVSPNLTEPPGAPRKKKTRRSSLDQVRRAPEEGCGG